MEKPTAVPDPPPVDRPLTPEERDARLAARLEAASPRSILACMHIQNLKMINYIHGCLEGDALIAKVGEALSAQAVGCWRTGGTEYMTLWTGELETVVDTLRAFAWSFHQRIGAEHAWFIESDDPSVNGIRVFEGITAVVTPRWGWCVLGDSPAAAISAARQACDDHEDAAYKAGWRALEDGPWRGFPELSWGPSANRLTPPNACPRCGALGGFGNGEDLGRHREHCDACGLSFSRTQLILLDGEVLPGGCM